MKLPAHGSRTVWLAVAGSDSGLSDARHQLHEVLEHPDRDLAAKIAYRQQLASRTQLSLPGDQQLAAAVDWGKQNLADLTLSARNLQIRWTNQGKQFPAPLRHGAPRRPGSAPAIPTIPGSSAPTPSTPRSPRWRSGQFEAIEDHLRALRDVSDILNDRSGVVTHEVVSDGSIWFGHDSRTTNPDGTVSYDFNTDETVKFPSTVALLWRWTGDDRFRDEMYDFTKRNLKYVVNSLDADHDGWPEGLGNVERTGMGQEKLDNTVYFIRGLYDLADMAKSKHDTGDLRVGHAPGRPSCASTSTAPGGTRPRRSTPTRWWTRATCSPSRSTGSARPRWRSS